MIITINDVNHIHLSSKGENTFNSMPAKVYEVTSSGTEGEFSSSFR